MVVEVRRARHKRRDFMLEEVLYQGRRKIFGFEMVEKRAEKLESCSRYILDYFVLIIHLLSVWDEDDQPSSGR